MTAAAAAAAAPARILADLERELRRAGGGTIVRASGLAPFGDGHSGFTYLTEIDDGGERRRCVLRLSPPGVRIDGPTDIGRQGRIMRSLAGSRVPVPAVIACSSEPVVDGRSFMLVELVGGETFAAAAARSSAPRIAALAIEALRALHAIERGAPGRSDLEELGRWTALLPRVPERVRAAAERLAAALSAAPPPPSVSCRVHGDYHYGNLLFADDRVVAVLDWEISAVAAPLWDLGSLIVASVRRRYGEEPNSMGSLAVAPGLLVDLYGCDPGAAAWFAAASCLKYAAIIGFNYELHRSGRREDPEYTRLTETMRRLPADGLALLERGLDALDAPDAD